MIWWVLLTILIIIFIFISIFWINQIRYGLSSDRIVFMPTISKKVLTELTKILDIENTENQYFVEFGAGLANIAGWISKNYCFRDIIAVEIDGQTIIMAKFWNFIKNQKLNFVQKNIFDYDLPKNSIVYIFLGKQVLTNLYLQKKLDGNLIISLTFNIKNLEPTKTINIGKPYNNLYIYDFRKN